MVKAEIGNEGTGLRYRKVVKAEIGNEGVKLNYRKVVKAEIGNEGCWCFVTENSLDLKSVMKKLVIRKAL